QAVLVQVPQLVLPRLLRAVLVQALQLVLAQAQQLVLLRLLQAVLVQVPQLALLRLLQLVKPVPQLVPPRLLRAVLVQALQLVLAQVLQLVLVQVPQLLLRRLLQAVLVQVQQQQQIHVSISGNLLWNKTGITVIGSSSSLVPASGVFVDLNDTLYATDETTHYVIWRLLKNAVNPTIVVGTSGSQGSSSTQLNFPNDVYVDRSGNIYVTDCDNHRVQKFNSGSNIGVTIAGTGSAGSALNQLDLPRYLTFDSTETYMYIADYGNHRVMRYSTSSTSGTNGVLIAG
ncbi:unnamed protein product, partial [Adineta steineri]